MSLFYFIQIFVDDSSTVALWVVSLISSSGFALAMDKALVMDLKGTGVNFSNLWSGPGMPFGGSLIMMGLDIVLYGFLAYYLDSVIPSEHGVKQSLFFCFKPGFWCARKPVQRVELRHFLKPAFSLSDFKIPVENGGSVGSLIGNDGHSHDVEQVPREMKGREAIKIVDLYKSFQVSVLVTPLYSLLLCVNRVVGSQRLGP